MFGNIFNTDDLSQKSSKTIQDVPVDVIYNSKDLHEPMTNKPRGPNILIQKGSEIWLYNRKLAHIPGVNPVVFHNLDEYTEFLDWQKSQGIQCPESHCEPWVCVAPV